MSGWYIEVRWLGLAGNVAISVTILFSSTAKLTVNNLDVVLEELYGVRTHWYNMGLKLKLKANTLDAIKSKCSGDPSECFREILKRYLQRVTPLPSWRSLVEALRSPIVDQPQLAEEVERRYCQALKLHGMCVSSLFQMASITRVLQVHIGVVIMLL